MNDRMAYAVGSAAGADRAGVRLADRTSSPMSSLNRLAQARRHIAQAGSIEATRAPGFRAFDFGAIRTSAHEHAVKIKANIILYVVDA